MKIIGKAEEGFILQATKTEAYNLVGYYSEYGTPEKRLEVGQEIQVNEMFKHLYYLNSHNKRIKEVIDKLNETANQLKEVDPILESIKNTTP